MRSIRGWRLALVSGAIILLLALAYVAAGLYTDQPQFCTSCHEMRPFVTAWSAGKHKAFWCVDCHVGGGYPGRMAHKVPALREVWDHVLGNSRFPLAQPPSIPDARCTQCHHDYPKKTREFDHAQHADKGPCAACHASAGHNVSKASLAAVGALTSTPPKPSILTTFVAVDAGAANVPGHVKVTCTRCHLMRQTGCDRCHNTRGIAEHPTTSVTCSACHNAGPQWVFTHPSIASACQTCHKVPDDHFKPAARSLVPCTACHVRPGDAWTFQHPAKTADCQSCHKPPAKHFAGQCSTCHRQPGVSFAFKHPHIDAPHGIGGRTCKQCHPSSFTQVTCTCHANGTAERD